MSVHSMSSVVLRQKTVTNKLLRGWRQMDRSELRASLRIRRWRRRAKKETFIRYCRFKNSCPDKRIKRQSRGVYLVLCARNGLCVQQSLEPQKIVLPHIQRKSL